MYRIKVLSIVFNHLIALILRLEMVTLTVAPGRSRRCCALGHLGLGIIFFKKNSILTLRVRYGLLIYTRPKLRRENFHIFFIPLFSERNKSKYGKMGYVTVAGPD